MAKYNKLTGSVTLHGGECTTTFALAGSFDSMKTNDDVAAYVAKRVKVVLDEVTDQEMLDKLRADNAALKAKLVEHTSKATQPAPLPKEDTPNQERSQIKALGDHQEKPSRKRS